MIDPFKALGWLKAIDNRSHLNKEDRKLIEVVAKHGLLDFSIEPILQSFRKTAHSDSDPLRKAEILLWCAAIGYSRGSFPQAARDATEAVAWYDIDNHRRAVALWILGIIQWEMQQHHNAHETWIEVKRTFKQCQSSDQISSNEKDWYDDTTWKMEVELVTRPEEISTWLNCFEDSSLKVRTWQIVQSMRDKIRLQACPNIYVLMQDLKDVTKQSESLYESAEIYVEFGLVAHQIGNSYLAVELLRKAVINFHPGIGTYHKQVVARCMLGSLEWMHQSSHNQAVADWLHCIDEFEKLRWLADRDNYQAKEEWYSQHCGLLRSALLERVEPQK